jgi:lipopolysaccharide transport system permease protein
VTQLHLPLRKTEAQAATAPDRDPPAGPQAEAAPPGPDAEPPLLVIERQPGWRWLDLRELWRYRELLYFLAWRDIKVRYKQTALGAVWAVLQPLATMVVFSLFFARLPGVAPEGVPYPLFVYAGLLPWLLFAHAISSAGHSVVGSQDLVTKVYFPRLIIPMGAVGVALVDFAVAFGMLVVLMVALPGAVLGWGLLMVPVTVLGLVVAALGVGTLLSALTVAYRDFAYVVPFLVQLWMFATPSIYMQPDAVHAGLRPWLPLNPAYGLIVNFRQAMLGGPLDGYALAVSSAVGVAFLVAGCLYFRRVERSFADII